MSKLIFSALALCLVAVNAPAQEAAFQDGVHYFTVQQVPGSKPKDTVEVTEVFSYLCNHCNSFEPYMQNWASRMPEGVSLNRIPVGFGRATWELYAQAYVAASVMGIADESHVPMMNAIWKENRQMRNMDELAEFYAGFGVEKSAFLATAKSFAVDAQMRRDQQTVRAYGVNGTPTMLVNNKYRVSAGGAVSNFDQMLAIVDFLVARELAAKTASAPAAEAEPVAASQ